MSKARKQVGRGALVILSLLLASSGALRIGSDFGEALALSALADAENGGAEPLNCPLPPLALAEALSAREARVTTQETALEDREAAVALAEQAIDDRLVALAKAEADLSATLAMADGAAEQDLLRLTEVYQAMKSKDAALLFDSMAPEFAAGFLGRMRPDAAAAVLSGMSTQRAYAVSVLLAGRNANVPTK